MAKNLYSLVRIFQFLRDKDVKLTKKLIFLIPIIYLIFPFDLIGDFFPLAGQLDDVAVFVVMWPILKSLLSKYEGGTSQNKQKKYKDAIDIEKDDYEVK